MNRLIITLMLALAFALSIARFAKAQETSPTTPITTQTQTSPQGKPHGNRRNHRNKPAGQAPSSADQSASSPDPSAVNDAPAPAAAPTDASSVGVRSTDSFVSQITLPNGKDGDKKIDVTYTIDNLGKIQADCDVCNGGIKIESKAQTLEAAKQQVADIDAQARKAILHNLDQETLKAKYEKQLADDIAECKAVDTNKNPRGDGKKSEVVEDEKGNPVLHEVKYVQNTTNASASSVDDLMKFISDGSTSNNIDGQISDQDQCVQNQIVALNGTKSEEDQRHLVALTMQFESNYLDLAAKVASNMATPAEMQRFQIMQAYQMNTIYGDEKLGAMAQRIGIMRANMLKANVAAAFQMASQNPSQTAQALNLAKQYQGAVSLAAGPNATPQQLLALNNTYELADLQKASIALTKAAGKATSAPQSSKDGSFSSSLTGEAGDAVAQADKNYASAQNLTKRILEGTVAPQYFNKYDANGIPSEPATLSAVSPNNTTPRFRFANGTGQAAAASGTFNQGAGYNAATQLNPVAGSVPMYNMNTNMTQPSFQPASFNSSTVNNSGRFVNSGSSGSGFRS